MTLGRHLSDNALVSACVLLTATVLTIFSEHIFEGNGLGWDGRVYGVIITNLENVLNGTVAINSGIYFRMVPALAIRYVMQALGVALTVPNVIVVFQILNVALLTVAAWMLGRILDIVGLSGRGKWLGYLGLFCNYAVLKYNFYYPVLLDTLALTCGVLLAWLYLTRRRWCLLAASLVSFFVGPNVGLIGFLLFLGPPERTDTHPVSPLPRMVAGAAAVIAAGAAGLILLPVIPVLADPIRRVVAAACSLLYWGGGVYCLARYARVSLSDLKRKGVLISLGIVAGVVTLLSLLPFIWTDLPVNNWVAIFFDYAKIVLINSTFRFGEFFLAHGLYFGPIFLIAVSLFPAVCREARRLGPGWLLVLAFALLQSLNPLSRQMIGMLAFIVPPACLTIAQSYRLTGAFFWGMVLASLAFSKIWLSINNGADLSQAMENQPEVWARYLSSTGYWMLEPDYQKQGVVVLVCLICLVVVLFRLRLIDRRQLP